MLRGIIFVTGVIGVIFFGFGVLGVVSDLILPHWKWLNDWIDTLPMMQAVDAEYEPVEEAEEHNHKKFSVKTKTYS